MILIELLEKINDNKTVKIIKDNKIISVYDGKNSIDNIYNNCILKDIKIKDKIIFIEI